MGSRKEKIIDVRSDEWLSELLLVMWKQIGMRDIEEESGQHDRCAQIRLGDLSSNPRMKPETRTEHDKEQDCT